MAATSSAQIFWRVYHRRKISHTENKLYAKRVFNPAFFPKFYRMVYELAHERLIPALRRIANKELTEADRANLLLDRRANEWQGNNRDKRYLFSWRELRSIGKQTPFLQWGQNHSVKQALLRASKRQLRFRCVLATLPFLLAISAVIIWNSQWGQLQLIKWEVARSSESMANDEALRQVAKAYLAIEEFSMAQGVAEKISEERYKASALVEIAKAMAEIGAKQRDEELLKQAQGVRRWPRSGRSSETKSC